MQKSNHYKLVAFILASTDTGASIKCRLNLGVRISLYGNKFLPKVCTYPTCT